MVAQGWVDRNFLLAPNAGLTVPNLPVVHVVAVVYDVSAEGDKRGLNLSDRLDKRLADRRVRRLCVFGIVEARVSIGDETEWSVDLQLQGNGLSFGGLHLRMGTRAGGTAEKNRDHEQSLENLHSLPQFTSPGRALQTVPTLRSIETVGAFWGRAPKFWREVKSSPFRRSNICPDCPGELR